MNTNHWDDAYYHEGSLGTEVSDAPLPNPVGFIHFKEKHDRPDETVQDLDGRDK